MMDYEPLDLSALCNADASILGEGKEIPTGKQTYHGLPFLVGPDEGAGNCVIAFGQGVNMQPVSIPVGATARHVIFAHRLLESKLLEGDPAGRVCGEYVFCFEDGQEVTVPIRERLEIGVIPFAWGLRPLLAWPDGKPGLQPRYEGRWGGAGMRLTEVTAAAARSFFLWVWESPQSECKLCSITVKPKGPRFYIGAVTLGHLDEAPLCRSAKRAVKLVLPQEEDAGKPFNLEVEVDRGVATYPYPLPQRGPEEFLADDLKGWGEAANASASPAHVEIAATPSATVTVKQDGEELGAARWGELEEKGAVEPGPRLRMLLVDRGRNWVRTTVLDDETGKAIPCRIHFRSPDGIPYQPHGHHNYLHSNLGTWHIDVGGDLRLGQVTYAYINGKCQGWLPRGEVIVDIARGYEYEPLRTKVAIEPGQSELTFRLKRLRNMGKERYFSGDTHVHFLSGEGAHLEAAGEGLNIVNLMQSQWGHLFTNTEDFTGRPSVSADGETIVYVSQENRQHILGHLLLLGLKEPVMPWCSDGPGEGELGGALETTIARWADACHSQGGTVIIPHFPSPNCEPAVLVATGRADAVEWTTHALYGHLEYYRYLNCGYRLPIVGGTDKMSADVAVGQYRTYVHIPDDEPVTHETWCKHLRAGRTFLSSGPLLRFQVEGQPVGNTVRLPKGGGTVEVEASAQSVLPFHCLEIVMNGRVVARTEGPRATRQLHLKEKVSVERHSWVAARCAGPNYTSLPHYDGWGRGIMAHTSPVYLAVGEQWWMFDAGAASYMLTLLHGGIDYIRTRSPQWPPDAVTHHHGREDHLAYLEEPYREAIEAIHQRMHQEGGSH